MGNTAPHPLESARSFLFTPGNRPDRFEKALASGADAVVLDLEDAVPPTEKPAAREAIAAAWPRLRSSAVPVVIRINPPVLPVGKDDLAWLAGLDSRPTGLMIPKAESAAGLAAARAALPGAALLPLIESAAGHAALSMIAAAPGVLRLVLGHIDFMADTGIRCSDDEVELAPLRFALTMVSRCNDLAPAVDGVTVDLKNDERLRVDTLRSLRFGFSAKLCIHPRQVAVVHQALRPTPDDIAWARRVLEADAAAGGQAIQLDGKIVDLPLVLQARRLLARADSGQVERVEPKFLA
jgi:citrate lyase subunit beta/citryl-CoA lyase